MTLPQDGVTVIQPWTGQNGEGEAMSETTQEQISQGSETIKVSLDSLFALMCSAVVLGHACIAEVVNDAGEPSGKFVPELPENEEINEYAELFNRAMKSIDPDGRLRDEMAVWYKSQQEGDTK